VIALQTPRNGDRTPLSTSPPILPEVASDARNGVERQCVELCPRCHTRLTTRLWLRREGRHVACPTPHQIAHARRMGRPL
jgi:hypothetical protein